METDRSPHPPHTPLQRHRRQSVPLRPPSTMLILHLRRTLRRLPSLLLPHTLPQRPARRFLRPLLAQERVRRISARRRLTVRPRRTVCLRLRLGRRQMVVALRVYRGTGHWISETSLSKLDPRPDPPRATPVISSAARMTHNCLATRKCRARCRNAFSCPTRTSRRIYLQNTSDRRDLPLRANPRLLSMGRMASRASSASLIT